MASFLSDLESLGLAKYAEPLSVVADSIEELRHLSKEDLEELTGLKLAAARLVYAKLHPRAVGGVGEAAGGSGEDWRDRGGGGVSQGGEGYGDKVKSGFAYDYGDAGQGASMLLRDTCTGRIDGGSGGSGSGRGGGGGSRHVLVEVSEYVGRGQKGDFSWMLKQPDWKDTLFIFNENQSCFLEKERDEGGGTAIIRPYRWEDPPRAAGVVTGVLGSCLSGSAGGYVGLDERSGELTAKEVIDLSLKEIRTIIERYSHIRRVIYSGDAATGALGTSIFTVAADVCEYIVTQLRTFADIDFPAGAAARATGIETSKPKSDRESDICNGSDGGDYKSAGILPVRIVQGGNRIEVLLCIEYRQDTNDHRVNILGGQVDFADKRNAATTAIREFQEETAKLLPMCDYERLLQQPTTQRVFVPQGKYVLFVVPALESMNSLPDEFERAYKSWSAEADSLVWLAWDRVLKSGKDSIITDGGRRGKRGNRISSMLYRFKSECNKINTAVRDVSRELTRDGGGARAIPKNAASVDGTSLPRLAVMPVLPMKSRVPAPAELGSVFDEAAEDANDAKPNLDRDALKKGMAKAVAEAEARMALKDDVLVERLFGKGGVAKLNLPVLPPRTQPIRLLGAEDPERMTVMQKLKLPESYRPCVYAVHKVDVLSRTQAYESARKQLGTELQGELSEIYHGTPEPWRAIAIAQNGYSIDNVLNGRAYGDGVYTVQGNPSVSLGYARVQVGQPHSSGAGSLLINKALKTEKDLNIVAGVNYYVFKKPSHLLPEYIVDFSASEATAQLAAQQSRQDARNLDTRRVESYEKAVANAKAFRAALPKRWRQSARYFIGRVQKWIADVDAAVDDDTVRRLSHQFKMEQGQFERALPIYAEKEQVLQKLRDNYVIVINAETGSGKSTQLPQYMLDDVIDPDDDRRIIVLEPKRVNATELCAQVARERGEKPGRTVGCRLGHGYQLNSRHTRIEFVTHGLFVKLAENPDHLLERYCCVIVDEAHERSLQVDMSLALLRDRLQTLEDFEKCFVDTPDMRSNDKRKHAQNNKVFRVIVTSATIEADLCKKFLTYLNKNPSCLLTVPGSTYPVQIVHRHDVNPQIQQGDTASLVYASQVISSAAVDAAIDIITHSTDGNVLVFLPGAGSIEKAVDAMRLHFERTAVDDRGNSADTSSRSKNGGNGSSGSTRDQAHVLFEGGHQAGEYFSVLYQQGGSIKRLGVYPFCGKLTNAERHAVFDNTYDDRKLIFATDMAETGITIPNVHFVVDSGFLRNVQWNSEMNMTEMKTARITKSSMKQRSGRAGRVTAGYCVRLYSAEVEQSLLDMPEADILHTDLRKVLLQLKTMEDGGRRNRGKGGVGNGGGRVSKLLLFEDIPADLEQAASQQLVDLGAFEDHNGTYRVTDLGRRLHAFGLDLSLGRFLLSCLNFGCIEEGMQLAAVLMNDSYTRLLPRKASGGNAPVLSSFLQKYADRRSDHLTLLAIFQAFLAEEETSSVVQWCSKWDIDIGIMYDTKRNCEYLYDLVEKTQGVCVSDPAKIAQQGGVNKAIMRSLISGYHRNLILFKKPGVVDSRYQFSRWPIAEVVPISAAASLSARPPSGSGANANCDVVVGTRSMLHFSSGSLSDNDTLALFHSVLASDVGQNPPQVDVVSLVTAADVEAACPDWCSSIDFASLLKGIVPVTESLQWLSKECKTFLKRNHGREIGILRAQFPQAVIKLDDELEVSASPSLLKRIGMYLKKQLQPIIDQRPEAIIIPLPDNYDCRKLNMKEVKAQLGRIADESGACGRDIELTLTKGKKGGSIKMELQRECKVLMNVFLGVLQSAIGLGDLTQQASSTIMAPTNNPRLVQMCTSSPPPEPVNRDDALTAFAHHVVWRLNLSVYGGFVRDWIVVGKNATDLDVAVADESKVQEAHTSLVQFAETIKYISIGLHRKGANGAFVSRFQSANNAGIQLDIDLVPSNSIKLTPPGVDSDIGNLCLCKSNDIVTMKLKREQHMHNPGKKLLSVAVSVEHAQKGQFVFYYDPAQEENQRRLKKLHERGFQQLNDGKQWWLPS